MIVCVDIGNSFIKWKVWQDELLLERGRIARGQDMVAAFAHLRQQRTIHLVLGNVSDQLLEQQLQIVLQPAQLSKIISTDQCLGVSNGYQQPERLGVDRWVAMIEAHHLAGRIACCVFDLGTAATLDVVDGDGRHQGGYIVPGLWTMKQSLLQSTQRVRFDPGQQFVASYGLNTADAVSAGICSMLLDWLEKEAARFISRYPGGAVFITGGDGLLLSGKASVDNIRFCEDLVLDGLRRIAIG